jgi:hypothetical protein
MELYVSATSEPSWRSARHMNNVVVVASVEGQGWEDTSRTFGRTLLVINLKYLNRRS